MNHIYSRLYQGNREDAIKAILSNEFDLIVYVGQEMPSELGQGCQKPVIHIPLNDGWNPQEKLEFVVYALQTARVYNTLLACRAGISRSSAISILWMMEGWGFQYHKAYEWVRKQIPTFNPVPELLDCVRNYGYKKEYFK